MGASSVPQRIEHDSLGEISVPASAYWGAQTERAVRNFPISGVPIRHFPNFLTALAMVKQAAAEANATGGRLSAEKCRVIVSAAQEIIAGKLHDQFPIDVIQGGAGTSTNMNMNEVLANRGLELLGRPRGEYKTLHPNDDVNMSQSTNDSYPTAVRVATLLSTRTLTAALDRLATTFEAKATAFAHVVKLGRTEMQDAVPMTLGEELSAFAVTIREDLQRLGESARLLHEINLGGTAIGTAINADPSYAPRAIAALSSLSGLPLVQSANLVEASWDMGGFVLFSGVLKRIATKLSKIGNDLRLLSSGPRGGFGEITLPAVQPGSSIMPGKVNPVMAEVLSEVCFQVIGHDLAVTMAAEAGQLQLNAFEPLIAYNVADSILLLTNVINVFNERCASGIEANEENCLKHVEASVSVVTALAPSIGYERASGLAKKALASGRTVREVAHAENVLPDEELDRLLDPRRLAEARS